MHTWFAFKKYVYLITFQPYHKINFGYTTELRINKCLWKRREMNNEHRTLSHKWISRMWRLFFLYIRITEIPYTDKQFGTACLVSTGCFYVQ